LHGGNEIGQFQQAKLSMTRPRGVSFEGLVNDRLKFHGQKIECPKPAFLLGADQASIVEGADATKVQNGIETD
jgi:hypothetical protein